MQAIPSIIRQAIREEFNGVNHAELAAKYQLSTLQIYTEVKALTLVNKKGDLLKAVNAVVAAPQCYQSLPVHLRSLAIRAVHAQAGIDAALRLLSLHSDAQPVADVCLAGLAKRQIKGPLKQFQVRQAALQWLSVVRSLVASHFVKS